jgi:nuclear transport factor 2 (NTF2) superfamily protein
LKFNVRIWNIDRRRVDIIPPWRPANYQGDFDIKELWAFTDDRIAVRFAYEWHDDSGNWFRS